MRPFLFGRISTMKYILSSGRIVSISDHVTLYPVPGTNGEGWTSDPPATDDDSGQINAASRDADNLKP